MFIESFLLFAAFFLSSAFAAPVAREGTAPHLEIRQTRISALSTTQISSYKPFTYYASVAYCTPAQTLEWNCGTQCSFNSDFKPIASGGDGASVQYWYVGYSSAQGSIIVAHQGTDFSKIQADVTDADIFFTNLDSSLFPGISSSVKVHSGFAAVQKKTAASILSAVKSGISTYGAEKVTVVGHSLGGAIAVLDGVYLQLQLSGVTVRTIAYGLPRVGNQEFADYVDSSISLTHINNKKDLVPIVPGLFLGYHHPSGEIRITEAGVWDSCPGQDNTSTSCIAGDVSSVFDGNTSDHSGPYDGVIMGCT